MKMKCPFCGSYRINNIDGENGNPFDRHPEKTVCLDCGMTVSKDVVSLATPVKGTSDSEKDSHAYTVYDNKLNK